MKSKKSHKLCKKCRRKKENLKTPMKFPPQIPKVIPQVIIENPPLKISSLEISKLPSEIVIEEKDKLPSEIVIEEKDKLPSEISEEKDKLPSEISEEKDKLPSEISEEKDKLPSEIVVEEISSSQEIPKIEDKLQKSGVAEFTCIYNQGIKLPGMAFSIDKEIHNNIPEIISLSSGIGGSIFTLKSNGVYVFDYETSLDKSSGIGIYSGKDALNLELDPNSISYSNLSKTWIRGRSFVIVSSAPLLTIISTVENSASIVSCLEKNFMIRLTILKVV